MEVHPIHNANEKSPFGNLTKEEFYKKHQILHQESFMLNKQNMKIFTQTWCPCEPAPALRGLVCIIHGYTDESSWFIQLTAVAIAKAGFRVCALDLQSHGYSEGKPRAHFPKIQPLVDDCNQLFGELRRQNKNLPAFLFGESMGGAIAILMCLTCTDWDGLVLSGAMCGVSKKFKPMWPLEELLPIVAFIAPKWQIPFMGPPAYKSYKEPWKRELVFKSPNGNPIRKATAATSLELLRVCDYITKNCNQLRVPLLLVHGGEDKICDPESARFVYDSAASTDKTLRIIPDMWHQFIGEPNETVEIVFGTILSWIKERAYKL